MAQPGSSTPKRPLSPYFLDGARFHWRWGPAMLSSILHRVTGVGATVGIFVLLWWLGALMSGPAYYKFFATMITSPIGYIVLVGISWAVIAHTLTGIRHFVLDIGAGYELDANNRWATVCTIGGIVLTAAFWAVLLLLR